jgi:hypothetical protein
MEPNPRIICQLLNQLFIRNAKKKLCDSRLLIYAYTFFTSSI